MLLIRLQSDGRDGSTALVAVAINPAFV